MFNQGKLSPEENPNKILSYDNTVQTGIETKNFLDIDISINGVV